MILKDESGDDKIAVTDDEKAAALEEFFSSVYTVEDDKDFEPLPGRITKNHKSMDVLLISTDSIKQKLAILKTVKSPGLDHLHPRVLFEIREVIAYLLCLIYNKSLSMGILPSEWKLPEVTLKLLKRCIKKLPKFFLSLNT